MSHLNLKFTKEEFEIWGKKIEATSTLIQGFPVETLVVETQETQVRSRGRKIPWRRTRQATPVFLPGELRGWKRPAGRLQVRGSQRVRHDWRDWTHAHTPHQSSASLSPRKNSREHSLFHMSKSCKDDFRKTLLNLSAVKQAPECNKNRYFET